MVYVILGKGFEEAEAVIPYDILQRAGVEVRFAAIEETPVTGGHGIRIHAECLVEDIDPLQTEMIVLPGGLGGVESILRSEKTLQTVRTLYECGKYVAAICAAPTVLAKLGLLDGRRATCYPGMEAELGNAIVCDMDAVRDGNVITGRAAGTAFAFALELVSALRGEEAGRKIATGVVAR